MGGLRGGGNREAAATILSTFAIMLLETGCSNSCVAVN